MSVANTDLVAALKDYDRTDTDALMDQAAERIAELEAIVNSQNDMLHNIASEAGFVAGEAYTWIEIVNRLREQGRQGR